MQQARLSEQDGQYNCKRLGAPESSRIRPLWIQFSSRSTAFELLVKSKNLKDSDQYNNIFINPDRTLQKRVEHKNLVEQLKVIKRAENTDKRFYIWNKSIRSSNMTV